MGCNRTRVRPATNEEAEGVDTVTSLLAEPDLKDARDTLPTSLTRDDEPTVVESDVMDFRLGRADSQPEPELNAPSNSGRTSASTDMEIVAGDRRVRFQEERADPPRHHLDASSDQEAMVEQRGKTPRRAETSRPVVPFHSSEASLSELPT